MSSECKIKDDHCTCYYTPQINQCCHCGVKYDWGEEPMEQTNEKWEPLPRGAFNMLTVSDANGTPIAHVTEHAEEHRNWRLIAAAPELLAMVKRLSYPPENFKDPEAVDELIASTHELIARVENDY